MTDGFGVLKICHLYSILILKSPLNSNHPHGNLPMTGLSVIIPTYNRSVMIVRALDSVKCQTMTCDEIIIVDDGSTDYTYDAVKTFSRNCEIPVQYFKQDNSGPAAARNRGIRESKFSHIAFLDSDDHWQKKKLQIQYGEMLTNPEYLVSHTKERWFRRGQHLNQKKIHQPRNGYIFDHCLRLCGVGMSTVMVRKELFETAGLFNEELRCCEDYDFWLRISCIHDFLLINKALTIKEGGRDDQVSYQYRIGMDRLRIHSIIGLVTRGMLNPEQTRITLKELQRKCNLYGTGCLKHGRIIQGRQYLALAEWLESALRENINMSILIPPHLIPQLDLKFALKEL